MLKQSTVKEYHYRFDRVTEHIKANTLISSDLLPQLFALLAISFIWIWSGVSSLISWDLSYELMNTIGANHQIAIFSILLGSFVDILLGFAILKKQHRRKILLVQVGFMLIYMLILSIFSPGYWIHPFGVLSKNIPLLALSYYAYTVSEKEN